MGGVTTSLNQTDASICVCDAKLYNVVQKSAKNCKTLKFLVPIMTPADPMKPEDMEKDMPNGIKVRSTDQLVDRKKDLFKGDNGEYVSLSKVESFIKLSAHVEFPMVYGRTGMKTVIALICPKKFAIEAIAKEKGLEGTFDELCKHEAVVAEVTKSCQEACKKGGLHSFEMPSAIVLCATPTGEPAWTAENEMLTTTMKLKRPIIAKAFDAEITDAYKRCGQ